MTDAERIDSLERRVAAIIAYIRERAIDADPAARWPGTTAELALRRLDASETTKPEGAQ